MKKRMTGFARVYLNQDICEESERFTMEAAQHLWVDQEENGVTLESIPKTMQEKKTLAPCSFYSTERGCNKDDRPKSLRCFQ